MTTRSEFLNPRGRYYGSVKPENLVFNANLQEFSNRISLLSGLHSNGKLSTEECYNEIQTLWKQLKHSKKELRVGDNPFQAQ